MYQSKVEYDWVLLTIRHLDSSIEERCKQRTMDIYNQYKSLTTRYNLQLKIKNIHFILSLWKIRHFWYSYYLRPIYMFNTIFCRYFRSNNVECQFYHHYNDGSWSKAIILDSVCSIASGWSHSCSQARETSIERKENKIPKSNILNTGSSSKSGIRVLVVGVSLIWGISIYR